VRFRAIFFASFMSSAPPLSPSVRLKRKKPKGHLDGSWHCQATGWRVCRMKEKQRKQQEADYQDKPDCHTPLEYAPHGMRRRRCKGHREPITIDHNRRRTRRHRKLYRERHEDRNLKGSLYICLARLSDPVFLSASWLSRKSGPRPARLFHLPLGLHFRRSFQR
jgi:hypothetical protein